MENLNLLTQKLENSVKLELYLQSEIGCHTNRILSNEALLSRIPEQMKEDELDLMKACVQHNVMKAELRALHSEMQIVQLQIANLKTEIGLQAKGEVNA